MMKLYFSLSLLFAATCLFGQSSDASDLKEHFAEGIYLTHRSFIIGEPDLRWDEIEGEMVQLPEAYRIQIAGLRDKKSGVLESVYAVSLDGYPYLFAKADPQRNYHEFAGLRLSGRYRYYEYTDEVKDRKMMYAYNPINGQPFRSAEVEVKKAVLEQRVVDLATGKTWPFSIDGVGDIVSTDNDLLRAVNALDINDRELFNKLMQALRLYNDRYPFKLMLPE
ncbi:MAG: hypothetical protein AAF828_03795 [Bacteroidota bacterium]